MVTYIPWSIEGMANLAQQNAKIGKTRQTATEQRNMARGELSIAAQPLSNLETFCDFKELYTFEVTSLRFGAAVR